MTHNPFKIPEKQFISEKMKKLLTHLCKINPLERMDKYEFLSLRLKEDKSQRVIPEVT